MLTFLLKAFLITFSGVIVPGPVSALTISQGTRYSHYGVFVALGHGIVEIPIMILILFGFGKLFEINILNALIGLLGGFFLLKLSYSLFKGINNPQNTFKKYSAVPLQAGIVLTIANPGYLAWMATIGSILILNSYKYGIFGFIAYAVMHLTIDIIWLYFLSSLSYKGGQFFGKKLQKIIFLICGFSLLYIGMQFIYSATKKLF